MIPESATRLQAGAFVQNAELSAKGRGEIIHAAAKKLAESAMQKILTDCVKTEGNYMGYPGQMLRLDVYVLSPEELHKMLMEAFQQGCRDAMRWPGRGLADIAQMKEHTTNPGEQQ